MVWLFMRQPLLVFAVPTHKGMNKLRAESTCVSSYILRILHTQDGHPSHY